MRVILITPSGSSDRTGNRTTALRWKRLLEELGHEVVIETFCSETNSDLMIALHARKSAPSIHQFAEKYPEKPLIVALSGTDIYRDLNTDKAAQQSLEFATRLVALQPLAKDLLPSRHREKTRVIFQSVEIPENSKCVPNESFDIAVVAHLRDEKDPLRAAIAARSLPNTSRVRILLMGAALDEDFGAMAREEEVLNPRFKWLGDIPRDLLFATLRSCRLLVLSSRMEGGANALMEAIAIGLPVLATRIDGSIGILGKDYPGYFEVGDTEALARLIARCESDEDFYGALVSHCEKLRPLTWPSQEIEAWKALLSEVS